MTKIKGVDRRRYWQEVIERQRVSGQSIVGFCAKEGLTPASFHAWKRRLRQPYPEKDQRAIEQALVPVQIITDPGSNTGSLEVQWPSGIVLRMQGFDAQAVGAIVAALSAPTTHRTARC